MKISSRVSFIFQVVGLVGALRLPILPSIPSTAFDVVKGKDLTGQTHVLTGGSSGIGYHTALALASKNATVVLGLRGNTGKYGAALENITRITGNPKVTIVNIELSKFSSVRSFAAEVRKRFPVIHSLICNAAMGPSTEKINAVTEDGFETMFQVNYLSHALLIEELLPTLRRSQGRVINVASGASYFACEFAGLPSDCMTLREIEKSARRHGYSGNSSMGTTPAMVSSSYGVTKALQVFHASELARRENQITVHSLHPGIVKTPILDAIPESFVKAMCKMMPPEQKCPITDAEGAATSVFLATEPLVTNGEFYNDGKPTLTSLVDFYKQRNTFSSELEYQKSLYDMTLGWLNSAK